jgi:hypothetical protein
MNILGIIISAALGVVALPLLMALLQSKPHNLSKEDVADEIEAFLNGTCGDYAWSDFCTFTVADPELDKIRARCAQLDEEFPPEKLGEYCGSEGISVLRGYVEYLRGNDA